MKTAQPADVGPLAALESVTLMAKAHVESYTRKDGVAVAAHDDRRPSAKPKAKKPVAVKTQNEGYGYHGEALHAHIRETHGEDAHLGMLGEAHTQAAYRGADERFSAAANKLVDGGHFDNHDDAREYLDTSSGRHLHDSATFHGGDISRVPWLAKDVKRFKSSKGLHKCVSALGEQSLLAKAHIDSYTRKDGVMVAAHDDKRAAAKPEYGHPNVVGTVHDHKTVGAGGKEGPGNGNPLHAGTSSIGFAGRTYKPTGKTGQSLHDQEPVAEFQDGDHRIWADGKGRAHADSQSEVSALREKHEKHMAAGGDATVGSKPAFPEMPALTGKAKTKAKDMLAAAEAGDKAKLKGLITSYNLLDGSTSPHVAYGKKLLASMEGGSASGSGAAQGSDKEKAAGMAVNQPIHGSTKKGEDGAHLMYSSKEKDWKPVTLMGVAGAVEGMKNPTLVKKLAQAYIDTAVSSKKYDQYHATMLIAQVIDEAGFGKVASALKEKSGGAPASAKAPETAPELPDPPEFKSGGFSSMAKIMHANAKEGDHEGVKSHVNLDDEAFNQDHPDVKAFKEFQQKAHAHALHVAGQKGGSDK